VIREIVAELRGRQFTDKDGKVCGGLSLEDILVVAPYNMQVRALQEALETRDQVGSVDKFQGKQARVVIVSMCASEGHESPRGIEFLLNPNRLNVALSRAQSLAYVVGHPGLARTRCRTPEQMKLVNLYCRLTQVGGKIVLTPS
jgi:superfamily I DNA and/or RNA helicase